MKRKVLIEKKENHVWTFFLEEDQIAEIHCTKSDEQEKVQARIHSLGQQIRKRCIRLAIYMSPKYRISYRI